MDAHLPTIESVSTFTARRFADHKSQDFGRHADRSANLDLRVVDSDGSGLQVSTKLFQSSNLAGGQGDAEFQVRNFFGDFFSLKSSEIINQLKQVTQN